MNRDQLLEVLEKHGVPMFQRDLAGGGTVVATQRGARLLGVFPCAEGCSGSAVWINPHLAAILTGKAEDWALEGKGQDSVGGDRLWVSPEQRYYYRNPAAFEDWFCPPAMDPGAYETIESGADFVHYRNRFELEDLLQGAVLKGVVAERRLTVLDNPLNQGKNLKSARKRAGYAGMEIFERLEVPVRKSAQPVLCPWGITPVPIAPPGGTGTVIVPTRRRAAPIDYFGGAPPDSFRVYDDSLIFKIDARHIFKFSVAPEDLPAEGPVRVAYIRPVMPEALDEEMEMDPETASWMLIVRESSDVARSSEDAIDPAKADPEGPRGVVQIYNSGPPMTTLLGEIEIQYLPVRRQSDGFWRAEARQRFLAYHGKKADILAIASHLLGLESIALFA